MLYVALTRAKRRLDLLVSSQPAPDASFAALLRHALSASGAPNSNESVILLAEHGGGTADPLLDGAHAPTPAPLRSDVLPAPVKPAVSSRLAWRTGGPRHVLRRRPPSAREGDGRARARDLLAHKGDEARLRGLLLHEMLAGMEWLDGTAPAREVLLARGRRRLVREAVSPERAPLEAWVDRLLAALARPGLGQLLSRQHAMTRAGVPSGVVPDLWRERPFLCVHTEGDEEVLVPGAFDRVVIFRDAVGKALGAEIIDFKTDAVGTPEAPDEAALAARVAHYAPQMQAYRRALAQIEGLAPGAIACRLVFLEADVVRDVPAA